ncbi:MAG: tRNA pseudouridine(55) synthase TruB [Clostridia bacterium]|nr:tRNA pseudouridine(55) synthase TruB [Clostridia bacterium]
MTDYVLNINKPEGFTSHDVVALLRGILKTRRIGHCGTLDPMATGVLPVCVGKATKASEFIMGFDKEYIAGLRLGFTSDTQDATGNITKTGAPLPSEEDVRRALLKFTGEQEQTPPMYSAIKIGGQKLYTLARQGVEVERKRRVITIKYIDMLSADEENGEYTLRIGCSKGTYIRTLCHDIGADLGAGALMASLVRTRTGAFTLERSVTLAEVEAGELSGGQYSLSDVFSGYPAISADEKSEALIRNGVRLSAERFSAREGETYAVYGKEGGLLCLSRAQDGVLKMIRGFY